MGIQRCVEWSGSDPGGSDGMKGVRVERKYVHR